MGIGVSFYVTMYNISSGLTNLILNRYNLESTNKKLVYVNGDYIYTDSIEKLSAEQKLNLIKEYNQAIAEAKNIEKLSKFCLFGKRKRDFKLISKSRMMAELIDVMIKRRYLPELDTSQEDKLLYDYIEHKQITIDRETRVLWICENENKSKSSYSAIGTQDKELISKIKSNKRTRLYDSYIDKIAIFIPGYDTSDGFHKIKNAQYKPCESDMYVVHENIKSKAERTGRGKVYSFESAKRRRA